MKKKAKKLVLNRETLWYLENVVGGISLARCLSNPCGNPGDGGTGSSPTVEATCYVCSNGCATGGACTVTC